MIHTRPKVQQVHYTQNGVQERSTGRITAKALHQGYQLCAPDVRSACRARALRQHLDPLGAYGVNDMAKLFDLRAEPVQLLL